MKASFARYRSVGHKFVTGFMEPEVLLVAGALDEAQRARSVGGAVAEIGVHHGKLFIGLHLLQRDGEKSVAIDIFGDQDLNIDGSGAGDLAKFTTNVDVWSSMDGVVIHQGDSTKLTPEVLLEKAGAPVRLFGVDGGHTAEIVYSDMQLAEATLADGGIVVADDVFNEYWPGVAVGTLKYLEDGAGLAPFAIGFNKVFFTQPEYSDYYQAELESAAHGSARIQATTSVFAGHPVLVLGPVTALDVLRRSETLRAIYHRTYRELVRGLQKVSGRGR